MESFIILRYFIYSTVCHTINDIAPLNFPFWNTNLYPWTLKSHIKIINKIKNWNRMLKKMRTCRMLMIKAFLLLEFFIRKNVYNYLSIKLIIKKWVDFVCCCMCGINTLCRSTNWIFDFDILLDFIYFGLKQNHSSEISMIWTRFDLINFGWKIIEHLAQGYNFQANKIPYSVAHLVLMDFMYE